MRAIMYPERFRLSLGLQTDMLFHRFNGSVIERDNYIVVRTPTNPTFFVTVRCRPSLDFVSVELAVRRSGLLPRGEVH